MSLSKQDLLAMNVTAIRKLCKEKRVTGINNRSTRDQCINALLAIPTAPLPPGMQRKRKRSVKKAGQGSRRKAKKQKTTHRPNQSLVSS